MLELCYIHEGMTHSWSCPHSDTCCQAKGLWQVVPLDFTMDLPLSQGRTAILVVVNLFSKMAHNVLCGGLPSAEETARLYIDQIFHLHGLPDSLLSDHVAQFTSQFWQALDIRVHLSSAHHPQSDGQTEQTNAMLEQYLCCYTSFKQDDWVGLFQLWNLPTIILSMPLHSLHHSLPITVVIPSSFRWCCLLLGFPRHRG